MLKHVRCYSQPDTGTAKWPRVAAYKMPSGRPLGLVDEAGGGGSCEPLENDCIQNQPVAERHSCSVYSRAFSRPGRLCVKCIVRATGGLSYTGEESRIAFPSQDPSPRSNH